MPFREVAESAYVAVGSGSNLGSGVLSLPCWETSSCHPRTAGFLRVTGDAGRVIASSTLPGCAPEGLYGLTFSPTVQAPAPYVLSVGRCV